MVDHIKQQLAAQGAIVAPRRTSGRGVPDSGRKVARTRQEIEADELRNPAIQKARAEVVGVGRLAWTNTTFGVPLACRKYLLADEEQGDQLDAVFYEITGTKPQ